MMTMKIEVDREVLHQMARSLLGTSREAQPTTTVLKMRSAAEAIEKATAVGFPVEIVAV